MLDICPLGHVWVTEPGTLRPNKTLLVYCKVCGAEQDESGQIVLR